MTDLINPLHYKTHPSGVECIEITENLNFNRGNAVKYVWRANDKGAALADLQKATWYVNREIDRLSIAHCVPYTSVMNDAYSRLYVYYRDYALDRRLFDFVKIMVNGGQAELHYSLKIIDSWIRELGQ